MNPALRPILLSGPRAPRLLGAEPAGFAISFVDGSMVVRDPTTAANNYRGHYRGKLTVVGGLDPGSQGAEFTSTRYASIAVSNLPFSAAAGSLIIAFIPTVLTAPANAYLWTFNDGTTANRITRFRPVGVAALISNRVTAASVGTVAANGGQSIVGGVNVSSAAWAANDFNAFLNGVQDTSPDTSVTLPAGMTVFGIGGGETLGANPLNDRLLYVIYVPRRITDTEQAAVTASPARGL